MNRSTKVSVIMCKLLIDKGMDGFSVVELRDASIAVSDCHKSPEEARKKIYRQILRFLKNNWLRSEGSGREKRYFQTNLFKALKVTPKAESIEVRASSIPNYSVLHNECNQYKGELEIVLGEIEEYQSLNSRFPELERTLIPLLDKAKERSAHLLGKVNGLANVLEILDEGNRKC